MADGGSFLEFASGKAIRHIIVGGEWVLGRQDTSMLDLKLFLGEVELIDRLEKFNYNFCNCRCFLTLITSLLWSTIFPYSSWRLSPI